MAHREPSAFRDEPVNIENFDNEAEGVPNMEGRTIDLNEYSYEHDLSQRESTRFASDSGDDGTFNNSTIATDDVGHDITRLYVICEEALKRQGASVSTSNRNHRMSFVISSTWDVLREWLAAHPMPGERAVAATYQGQFMTTALHIICKLPNPPTDVVQSLIQCAPETVTWADSNDWLPLHHACANGASYDVLSLLVEAYPNTKVAQDRRRRTPLHFAFSDAQKANAEDGDGSKAGNSIVDVVRLLSDSGAAQLSDATGKLPIHYACAYGTRAAVLEVLVKAYPDGIFAKEESGRTPLHLAMVNAHRPASLSVLSFLLQERGADIINISDNYGFLPLHLLAMACRLSADKVEERRNATECLRMYLAAQPKPTADFLSALQALPDWLRDEAVVTPHVQKILNDKIGKRFPTFILLLDGYFLIAIIACFDIASSQFIRNSFDDDATGDVIDDKGLVIFLFVGGGYFLLREVAQMIALGSLGTFSSWYQDLNNWLDVLVITLTVLYGCVMMSGTAIISNETFRSGVAFSKAVFWTGFIVFLRSIRIEFAVFLSGVIYVVRRLTAFLIAMTVILLAFAQMFEIVYKETERCKDGESFPHCTLGESLLRVIRMMMGEVGPADLTYRNSNVAIVLFVAYAFLVVIVLSTVLIAIVVDSYGVIKNERAAMVFWSNRLDFVAEMDAIIRVFGRAAYFLTCKKKNRPGSKANVNETAQGTDTAQDETTPDANDRFRAGWESLMNLLEPEDIDVDPWGYEFWCYFIFRVVAVLFIIPLWLGLGALTAGILWPPQVRSWLFVQKHASITQADIKLETTRNIKLLKAELSALRAELKVEVRSDRKEVTQMQDELDTSREDIMANMNQMRELMTTLLDGAREQIRLREGREANIIGR
mmetsp:Transcript_9093/g.12614  ORF Transcript_9093/g.12614 Transcript_9093/m.12614 type:complete len:884 (-) Transcript_9093:140-2791(-)|eukprot:CAMPEP_0185732612 /NCGR_PEP_ID=MMETSP1171-20130828/16830_1 /TAXON_ID=374046 /ORGANISM="Helicotheca tamensis, Strain CCMP826" /LENGTH=883 /DNA_ID=CAMNT_0028402141 /DNA_START=15 /DNA_END=2666 /DNA_ORIENTATION=+